MRYRLAAAAASLALFVGCIAHEKEGDSASAVGDWKTAYVHYRQALTEKPDTPGLKGKFDNARVQALAQSRQQANTCLQQRDWTCVGSEAQFILSVEPGAADASALKAQASLYQALDLLQQARTAAAQRQFSQAADAVKRAQEMSNAPEVANEAARVKLEIAAAAVAESDRLRAERKYNEAVEAMKIAIQYDPSQGMRLRQVEQERDQWLAYMYEKSAYEGDQAMAKRDWRAAGEHYRAALAVRAGGRAEGLARYCDAMSRGETAILNRQYDVATTAYQEAVATNLDKGEARQALDKLRVRPYDIAIKSVLLVPTKPDGSPWTGPTTPLFFRVAQFIQQHITGRAFDNAVQMAMTVPNENRPEIRVEVMLPNGTRLVSKPVTGLYATLEGNLVMATNGYDDRHLLFRVMQRSANPANTEGDELGRMDVALRDLCQQGDIFMTSESISQLRVTARPADGRQEGTFAGLTLLQPATAPAGGTTGTATATAPTGPTTTTPAGSGTPPPTGSGTVSGSVVVTGGTTTTPPPSGGAAASGTVVVTGGTTVPPPPPPAGMQTVTYVPPPPPKAPPPPVAPAVTAPPPKPPPVAPPMAPQIVIPPPPGQPAHGATPVAAPPAAGTPPAGAGMAPPPPVAQPGGTAVTAPPAKGGGSIAPGEEDADDDEKKGPRGKGKNKGKKRGRALGHEKDAE